MTKAVPTAASSTEVGGGGQAPRGDVVKTNFAPLQRVLGTLYLTCCRASRRASESRSKATSYSEQHARRKIARLFVSAVNNRMALRDGGKRGNQRDSSAHGGKTRSSGTWNNNSFGVVYYRAKSRVCDRVVVRGSNFQGCYGARCVSCRRSGAVRCCYPHRTPPSHSRRKNCNDPHRQICRNKKRTVPHRTAPHRHFPR